MTNQQTTAGPPLRESRPLVGVPGAVPFPSPASKDALMDASASQTGLSPTAEPVPVSSANAASIPSAEGFAHYVRATLAAHPDWLPYALTAVSSGMNAAIEHMNELRAKSDMACLAALSLAGEKRLTPGMRATLLGKITEAMHPPGLCELERRFAASAIEARRAETQGGSVHESAVPQADAQSHPGASS